MLPLQRANSKILKVGEGAHPLPKPLPLLGATRLCERASAARPAFSVSCFTYIFILPPQPSDSGDATATCRRSSLRTLPLSKTHQLLYTVRHPSAVEETPLVVNACLEWPPLGT